MQALAIRFEKYLSQHVYGDVMRKRSERAQKAQNNGKRTKAQDPRNGPLNCQRRQRVMPSWRDLQAKNGTRKYLLVLDDSVYIVASFTREIQI